MKDARNAQSAKSLPQLLLNGVFVSGWQRIIINYWNDVSPSATSPHHASAQTTLGAVSRTLYIYISARIVYTDSCVWIFPVGSGGPTLWIGHLASSGKRRFIFCRWKLGSSGPCLFWHRIIAQSIHPVLNRLAGRYYSPHRKRRHKTWQSFALHYIRNEFLTQKLRVCGEEKTFDTQRFFYKYNYSQRYHRMQIAIVYEWKKRWMA